LTESSDPSPPLDATPNPDSSEKKAEEQKMSRAFDPPPLTPQFCFNQTALRDFLRLSRSTIDDSMQQHLTPLLTPSSTPWNPYSTSTRQTTVPPAAKRAIPPTKCKQFKEEVLFPSWQTRSDVLNYCASVATSPDPEDPDSVLRQVESVRARERVVDERLDPYSARYFPREARTEELADLVRRERMVEDIVRKRSWGLVKERCAGSEGECEKAFDEWRRGIEKAKTIST